MLEILLNKNSNDLNSDTFKEKLLIMQINLIKNYKII